MTTAAQTALATRNPGNFVAFQALGGGAVRYVYDDGSFLEKTADGAITAGPFSPKRAQHQQATTSDVTGDIPTPALMAGCRRTDGGSAAHASQELLGWRAASFGWAGCLDAPELIATGSHVAAYSTEGFEGIVSRSYPREAA